LGYLSGEVARLPDSLSRKTTARATAGVSLVTK